MSKEEAIKEKLINKFSYLDGKVNVQRVRRIFTEVDYVNFLDVFVYLKENLGFGHLCTITGLDEAEKMSLIYHLADTAGIIVNLRTSVLKENPKVKTVSNYFPGAQIYERELIDLLGFKVEGLPEGSRYPLTDDWPKDQFPLRKDWKDSVKSSMKNTLE